MTNQSDLSEENQTPVQRQQLNRRQLLVGSAVGGALALGAHAASSVSGEGQSSQASGSGQSGKSQGSKVPAFELEEITFYELRQGMEQGRWTAQEITERYLKRIEDVDRQGPALNSVIETNPDAVKIAEQLDAERRDGKVRGPLHGIPILLKDNIATHDRNTTTAGALALEGSIPAQDSFVARQLRAAGAVLLGKANLSEWANFRSTNSSSGWSGRGRQCKNPYALDRNPCGSSSGSGAATSGNLTAGAIGTETNGSIVCPSSANGLVGIKPTVGLVSRTGIIPISHTQDTAGPMTRTLRDGALILGALTGVDPQDKATAGSKKHAFTDYTSFLQNNGLQGARIGVERSKFGFSSRVDALMEEALEVMRSGGAEVIDLEGTQPWEEMDDASFQVLLYEFKAGVNAYLASLGEAAPVKTLAEVIAFNEKHQATSMPYFGQELLIMAEEKGPLTSKEYVDALAKTRRLTQEDGLDKVMGKHRLGAIVAPTGGPAWTTDLVNGDHFGGGSSTAAAVAGYPNITVPAGFVFGLPVGISIYGRAWSEPTLLKIAYGYEQATKHRQAPKFLSTLDLG